TVNKAMQRQILDDGVYCELSSYYHCYAADFYLHVLSLAKQNRFDLGDWVWPRLSAMFEFIMHLARRDGSIPLLGDDDGGRVLGIASTDCRSYGDGLCSAAVLFEREDFKYQAREFCEETFWILGQESWSVFNSFSATPAKDTSRLFENSGYVIQRS